MKLGGMGLKSTNGAIYLGAVKFAFGVFIFEQLPTHTHTMSASRGFTTDESGTAISSTGALAALKIAFGCNPKVDAIALSPYQLIAADVNADGKLTSADVLTFLKMADKRSDAPAREGCLWMKPKISGTKQPIMALMA